RMIASAPRVWAFSTYFRTLTGTNSIDRQTGSSALPWVSMGVSSASDRALRTHRGDALAGVADAAVDLVIMLAELRRRPAQCAGSPAQPRHDSVHRHLAHLLVRNIDDDAALLDVRVLQE